MRGLLLVVLLLQGACVERLVDFSVRRLEGVRCTGIDGNGFNLVVRCRLENPNPLGARVSQVRFRTFTGENLLGQGRLPQPVEVAPRTQFTLEVPVRVAYADLPADLPGRVQDGALPMRTEVDLTATSKLGSLDMHLTATDKVQIAQAMRVAIRGPFSGQAIRIQGISLAGLELRRVKLRIRLVARNMFAFPVHITSGRYSIAINGSHFGDGKLEQAVRLPPRGQVLVDAKVLATHGAVGQAIAAMMGAAPGFRLTGTLWIEPIAGVSRLPLDVEADSSIFNR